MGELFVGGLAGIDVGVPEFEAIKHPGESGRWGAGEQKSSISKQSERRHGIFKRDAVEVIDVSAHEPRRIPSKKWRDLIKKVWEADPLRCPKCSREMRIVSLIDGFALASPHPITG